MKGSTLSGKHVMKQGARTHLPWVAAIVVAAVLLGSALIATRFGSADTGRKAANSSAAGVTGAAGAAGVSDPAAGAAGQVLPQSAPSAGSGVDSAPASTDGTLPSARANRGTGRTAPSTKPGTTTSKSAVTSTGTCDASFYDTGAVTANGEAFDPEALTAASKTLPFNTRVRVTNQANSKQVVVRINDRGPFVVGRCIDLARGAFRQIASLGAGVLSIRFDILA